jgi:N-glycosylase/DNA lyase|tara:strand:- start:529 stop:705 length:177 start_codon:yes stop_codon:yes gene_type:complete
MSIHEEIVQAYQNYLAEHATFEEKGVKAAAARARKALGDLGKLSKSRRAEVQEKKNNM